MKKLQLAIIGCIFILGMAIFALKIRMPDLPPAGKPLLSDTEIISLTAAAKAGNRAAENKLIQHFVKLPDSPAKQRDMARLAKETGSAAIQRDAVKGLELAYRCRTVKLIKAFSVTAKKLNESPEWAALDTKMLADYPLCPEKVAAVIDGSLDVILGNAALP